MGEQHTAVQNQLDGIGHDSKDKVEVLFVDGLLLYGNGLAIVHHDIVFYQEFLVFLFLSVDGFFLLCFVPFLFLLPLDYLFFVAFDFCVELLDFQHSFFDLFLGLFYIIVFFHNFLPVLDQLHLEIAFAVFVSHFVGGVVSLGEGFVVVGFPTSEQGLIILVFLNIGVIIDDFDAYICHGE